MSPVSTAPMDNLPLNSEDTEITLGTGKMLALFFGLVILCAIFFGMGYSMGKSSLKSTAELLPSPSPSSSVRPSASANKSAVPEPAPEQKPAEQPAAAQATGSAPSSEQPSAPDQLTAAALGQPGAGYFVQVAAVSKEEDAQALVEALKGRQYAAFIAAPSPDKLFHVQVGPFADVKDAESTRSKLVNDGYNPILKK
jgi:DedD protein